MKRRALLAGAVLASVGVLAGGAAAATSPSTSTGKATSIKQTRATLQGTVNPNGSPTSYFFQLGLTNAYGVNTHPVSAGSGTSPVSVKTLVTGLIPGTVYHYHLVAANRYGITTGADRTFTTAGPPPPGATTGPATALSSSGATLTGVITPNGAITGWRFQYGLTTAYTTFTNGGTLPAGTTPQVVTESLAGLAQGTIFHYRLVAFHGSTAVSYGADQMLMTYPFPRPTPTVTAHTHPHRAGRAPYVFTTTGHVGGPSSIPSVFDCTGYVAVRLFSGTRSVSFVLAPVQPDCTYSAQNVLTRLPGHGAANRQVPLTVAVRFRGNGYLTSAHAHRHHVVAG